MQERTIGKRWRRTMYRKEKKKIALAHRLDLILHDPAWETNLVDPDRLDLCIMYVM
jgi:hypothetical protein